MRETRRSLKAENTQLRAQLAVHDHATRKSLQEYTTGIVARNQHLVEELKKSQERIGSLERDLAATAQTETA